MLKPMRKKGNILTGNIVFIVLNLVFITILLVFLFSKTGSAAPIEEKYAKEIAMAIDAAEPVMAINITMTDAISQAEKNNFPRDQIVTINGNIVTVKLRQDGGYSYSFFNDVDAEPSFNTISRDGYRITINTKQ